MTTRKKTRKDPASDCPTPYESGWFDIGSRTISTTYKFTISYQDGEFNVLMATEPMSSDDVFHELSYWPKGKVWTGSARSLGQLLEKLAAERGIDLDTLRWRTQEALDFYLDEIVQNPNALPAMDTAPGDSDLWADLDESFDVREIPCPETGVDYDALELKCNAFGCTGTLLSDGWDNELLHLKEENTFSCLEDLCGFEDEEGRRIRYRFPELREILVDHDPRWACIIEKHRNKKDPTS